MSTSKVTIVRQNLSSSEFGVERRTSFRTTGVSNLIHNPDERSLLYYDGSTSNIINTVPIYNSQPVSHSNNDVWIDSSNQQIYFESSDSIRPIDKMYKIASTNNLVNNDVAVNYFTNDLFYRTGGNTIQVNLNSGSGYKQRWHSLSPSTEYFPVAVSNLSFGNLIRTEIDMRSDSRIYPGVPVRYLGWVGTSPTVPNSTSVIGMVRYVSQSHISIAGPRIQVATSTFLEYGYPQQIKTFTINTMNSQSIPESNDINKDSMNRMYTYNMPRSQIIGYGLLSTTYDNTYVQSTYNVVPNAPDGDTKRLVVTGFAYDAVPFVPLSSYLSSSYSLNGTSFPLSNIFDGNLSTTWISSSRTWNNNDVIFSTSLTGYGPFAETFPVAMTNVLYTFTSRSAAIGYQYSLNGTSFYDFDTMTVSSPSSPSASTFYFTDYTRAKYFRMVHKVTHPSVSFGRYAVLDSNIYFAGITAFRNNTISTSRFLNPGDRVNFIKTTGSVNKTLDVAILNVTSVIP